MAWRAAGGACALVYAAAEGAGLRARPREGPGGGGRAVPDRRRVVLQAALRVAKRTKGVAARAQLAEDLKLDPAAPAPTRRRR